MIELHKKVVVAGLENAGKTSIIKLAMEKMVDPLSMTPTKGIERKRLEIFGQEIVIHDFGGQKKYKDEYLTKPDYFEGTDAILFVIDLQDSKRYDDALEYYEKLLDILVDLEVLVPCFAFLHKFDGIYHDDYDDKTSRTALELEQLKVDFKKILPLVNKGVA